MKFVDEKSKKLRWYNRNYFWMVSIIYIAVNILLFQFLGKDNKIAKLENTDWMFFDCIKEWLIVIGNTYTHSSWEHVLHNMLGLSFCAFYVERKMGSINFATLLISLTLFTSSMVSFWIGGLNWSGNSAVWFALVGYVLIDYLFSLRKSERNLENQIVGAVVLILEWFRLGFYDKIDGGIGWVWFPYQLVMSPIHTIGFVVGVIVALIVCLTKVQCQNKDSNVIADNTNQNSKRSKASRGLAIFMIFAIAVAWVWLPVYLYGQSKREYVVKFEIDCNIDEYDCVFYAKDLKVDDGYYTNEDVIAFWLNKFNLNYGFYELDSSEFYPLDRINGETHSIIYESVWGDATYKDPTGTGDYLGGDYLFTITLP